MSTELFDDEYDPLAPIAVGTADGDVAVDGEDELDDGLELGSVDDGGFGNAFARIWFDDDGRLAKVRVSPVWFRKLGPEQTLEQAFHEAFRFANLRVAEEPEGDVVEVPESELQDIPPFSREAALEFAALLELHTRDWVAAEERAAANPPAPAKRVSGKSGGVTLTLDEHAHPHTIHFDERWLDDAQVGSICTHVLAAAHKAYGKYVPATDDHADELDRFRRQHHVLLARMQRFFNPRGN